MTPSYKWPIDLLATRTNHDILLNYLLSTDSRIILRSPYFSLCGKKVSGTMHTPLHGIARQGVPGTSYSISYDVMKITLDLPVIVHNNPSPPPPPPPAGGGMGALNKIFNQGGSVCSISIVPGRKLNKTQLKLEFCFPNSDHVMFSREFAFCLFINYAYMCRWIYVHRTTFERNNSLGYREQAYKLKGLLLHNLSILLHNLCNNYTHSP